MSLITINYDFKTGNELPYKVSKMMRIGGTPFETNCICMFSFDTLFHWGYTDVIIKREDGRYISAKGLLENNEGEYTDRVIRRAHNLQKMFTAGAFEWMSPIKDS